MTRRLFFVALAGFFITACFAPAQAKGRRPDDEDKDNYPDYNRLEMHPKPRNVQVSPTAEEPPAMPTSRPSLNAPANAQAEDDTVPQPAPKAVPLSDSASEPPLPGDMQDTLIPSATIQK